MFTLNPELTPSRQKRLYNAIQSLRPLVYYPHNERNGTVALNHALRTKGSLNGTISGGAVVGSSGKDNLGPSFKYDGVDDFTEVNNSGGLLPLYQYSSGFTVGLLVKCPDYSAADAEDKRFYAEGNTGSLNQTYSFGTGQVSGGFQRTIRMFIRDNTSTNLKLANSVTAPLKDNTWQFLILTDANGTIQVYVDGVEVAGTTFNYTRGTLTLNRSAFIVLPRSSNAGFLNCNAQHAFAIDRAITRAEALKVTREGGFI